MKQNSAAEMRTKITRGKYMAAKHLTSLFDLVQAGVFWDKIGKWRTVCAVQDGQLLDLLSEYEHRARVIRSEDSGRFSYGGPSAGEEKELQYRPKGASKCIKVCVLC